MVIRVLGPAPKTAQDRTWRKGTEPPSPYVSWNTFLLEKNSMTDQGSELGGKDVTTDSSD